MYICICSNVTDSEIKLAVENGARDVRDLNRELCVGSCCGKCTRAARQIINSHVAEQDLAYSAAS
ncbi:(2Fe-2S)-binding protein [Amphritea sp. HPY]|uniref:(2Fe-2S)-binding protein n=1 Tax=Amphritea sp. HPY TaxID=3421652 RepID=UPI003D7CD614